MYMRVYAYENTLAQTPRHARKIHAHTIAMRVAWWLLTTSTHHHRSFIFVAPGMPSAEC